MFTLCIKVECRGHPLPCFLRVIPLPEKAVPTVDAAWLVQYYKPSCMPCRQAKSELRKVSQQLRDRLIVSFVNCGESRVSIHDARIEHAEIEKAQVHGLLGWGLSCSKRGISASFARISAETKRASQGTVGTVFLQVPVRPYRRCRRKLGQDGGAT